MTPPAIYLISTDTRTVAERLADYHQDARAVHADNARRRDTTTCVLAYSAGRVTATTQLTDMAQRLSEDAFGLYLQAYAVATERQH